MAWYSKSVGFPEVFAMPRGPQGQKRPADTIGCAVMVAKIATGELEPDVPMSGRMRSGRAGAKGRMDKTTAAERTDIAKKAAAARWK
jgi:hypothetical protein